MYVRNKTIKKLLFAVIIQIIIITVFISTANADVGPKPSLKIIVHGIDTDEYWLDLLVKDDSNHSWLELTSKERDRVSKLVEYKDKEGFRPALLVGTSVPISGNIHGEKQSDGSYVHKFGYIGVPKIFKIAILKNDGTLIISDIVERKQFQSVMKYDLKNVDISEEVLLSAGQISEKIPWIDVALGFAVRLITTLVIEILIAVMIGFTLKNSFKILFITNSVTQIILNCIVLFFNATNGLFAGVFVFIIAELFILILEIMIYFKLLTEKSKSWRIIYAILANIISFVAGFILFFILYI